VKQVLNVQRNFAPKLDCIRRRDLTRGYVSLTQVSMGLADESILSCGVCVCP
jgi:hypothetical protein